MARKIRDKWSVFFESQLKKVSEQNRLRSLAVYDTFEPGYVMHQGQRFVNFSSNDYLGLAKDFSTLEEAKILGEILPAGAGASRLITGTLAIHHELEKLIAAWKSTEDALAFPAGFQMNIGLISTLVKKRDAVFSDKLNHASLIDGCMLSGADVLRYKHKDMKDLEKLLKTHEAQKKVIVTDGVFSMDGDLAPLDRLNQLAKQYGALLVVDEAHATGIMGKDGAGCWSYFGLPVEDHVVLTGTLSKAVGSQGGFICGSEKLIQYLINYCRPFIFTTGLSPLLAGLAHYTITRIREEPEIRERFNANIQAMRTALQRHGFALPDEPSPIFPVKMGESRTALECAQALKEKGFITVAVRPPTVREGTARLRLSVSAMHHPDDIDQVVHEIAEYLTTQERHTTETSHY